MSGSGELTASRIIPLAALLALVVIGTGAFAPVPFLQVEVPGREAINLTLYDGDWFNLRYRHSVYDAPVDELYRVEGAALRQVAIQSEDLRALEYYGLPAEPRRRGSGFVVAGRAEPIAQIDLAVRADQIQALVYRNGTLRLSEELGDTSVTLRPVHRARLAGILPGTR